jgi:hypothetical protein
MATLSEGAFRFLSLCAQRPGSAAVAQRLSSALATVPPLDDLAIAAEQHGMEPLVLAHIERTHLAIPADVHARLRARRTQHAHAAAVRTRVIADVASAMERAGVPFLVLKGAALAHLVYGDPGLRPMRDVDLLIRKVDAGRALDVLMRRGFRTSGAAIPSHHHHFQGMARTLEGATVTIELHHELLYPTPFVEPRKYDDLIGRSQPFEWNGVTYRTLGREDMLWHVYAHAFVILPLRPGAIRLLSVADLVHATEAWVDQIDWARLRGQYPRLLRALHVVHDLVPWSPHVAEILREHEKRPATAVRAYPIDSATDWSVRLLPDVLWPPEWWFRMRYGITSWPRWVWFRVVGHPAHLPLPATRAVLRRLKRWFGLRNGDAGLGPEASPL